MTAHENELHSDESNMGDYELIDTDGESRDDNATESVASTDFPRPDDVASLADTEKSEEYSDDDASEEIPEPPAYAHYDNFSAFANTPTIGQSVATERSLNPPIEFEEPLSLGAENISVKHTIADFNEEQTSEIVEGMGLQNAPQRLVATIHQTMSKQSLSMEKPLHILYVGQHSAKQDIIHKIASSATASVDNRLDVQSGRHASQVYNVVKVSDFGSERTPEIELMQSSGYQIKVEDCVSTINMKFEDQPGKPDVIKLTLEGGFSYHSVPEGSEFIVEPGWDLPNVAIIYCSATDDLDARRTRTLAKTFMSRHGIPSLVISHKQLFDKSLGCMLLDQHALHMCLESRDPNGARNIIHQRLPIDLASFLNVDARQMNRNLAYLTGRHETGEDEKSQKGKTSVQSISSSSYLKGVVPDAIANVWDVAQIYGSKIQRSLGPMEPAVRLAFLAVALAFSGAMITQYIVSYKNPAIPSLSLNGSLGLTTATPLSTTVFSSQTSNAPIMSPKLATSAKTSPTVVPETEAKSQNQNSLMSHIDLSTLSETLQNFASPSANKEHSCAAQIIDEHKILMRIPAGIKMSWLAKGDMSVNISREGKPVRTENVYSSPDGIILELQKDDAYGQFQVSVVTTKKPKINEVFTVDFGSRSLGQELMAKLTSLMPVSTISKDLQTIEHQLDASSRSFFGKTINETRKLANLSKTIRQETLKNAHSASMELVKGSAVLTKEIGLRLSDANKVVSSAFQSVEDKVDDAIFKAQIRSKLYWLKLQGKHSEYDRYKKRAMQAMAAQADRSAKRARAVQKSARRQDKQQRKCGHCPKKSGKKGCGCKKAAMF